jgi:hypothetical protein
MEMYAAYYPPGYDLPISTFFWGAVIVVAVVAAWILVGNSITRQRNRRSDGRAVDEGHREDARFVHTLADIWHQTDEVPLTDQTRGQRKAIKERRKAREKAQKHQNRKSDAVAVEAGTVAVEAWPPEATWDQTISSALADHRIDFVHSVGLGGLEGMTQREQEEFFSTYAPRKVRKAMKQRQKAREQTTQQGKDGYMIW